MRLKIIIALISQKINRVNRDNSAISLQRWYSSLVISTRVCQIEPAGRMDDVAGVEREPTSGVQGALRDQPRGVPRVAARVLREQQNDMAGEINNGLLVSPSSGCFEGTDQTHRSI